MRLANLLLALLLVLARSTFAAPADQGDSVLKKMNGIRNDSVRIESLLGYQKQLWSSAPASSVQLGKDILAEALKTHSPYLAGRAHAALGYSYLLTAEYPDALRHFFDALPIWRQLRDPKREVETLLYIVNIHTKNGNLDKARQYALEAIRICETQQVQEPEAKAYNELAIIYQQMQQPEQAIGYYRKGIDAARRAGDRYFESFLQGNIGLSYKSLHRTDDALLAYRTALAIGDSLQDPYISAVAWLNIGDAQLETHHTREAEASLLQAVEISRRIHETEILAAAYGLLSRLQEERGNLRQALDYFRQQTTLRDSAFNREKSAQLAEMQTRFDTRLKDARIDEQHRQIILAQRLNILLWAGIALFAGAGFLIWKQRRKVSRQKAELEQLNAVKNMVFSVISHDMRTPLTSLLAFTDLLEQGDLPQEKLRIYSGELKHSMTDTANLLDNLLHWSKTQMQGYQARPERLDIQALIHEVARPLEPVAAAKKISIHYPAEMTATAVADRNMLLIVIRNLLYNAIKFTPAGGAIEIALTIEAPIISVLIIDTGIGFPEADLAMINDPDNKTGLSSRKGTGGEKGTGIGLLLCKTLAEQMHGTLKVRPGKDCGSIVTLTLPAA